MIVFSVFTAFSVHEVKKEIPNTDRYIQKQVNGAMNSAARHFRLNYPDCKLIRLYTDDDFSFDDKIVILADYYVGTNAGWHPAHTPDTVYKCWEFEMKNICGLWTVVNQGYC